MSLLRRGAREASLDAYLAARGVGSRAGSSRYGEQSALKHSVVWGAQRLRADLLSLMPVDVYRTLAGVRVEAPKPAALVTPWEIAEDQPMSIGEWVWATQAALDRTGNAVGIVHSRDGHNLPARIEPVHPEHVSFRGKGSTITEYRIAGEIVAAKHLWHERQYTVAGIPWGLSPLAHAALQLSAGMGALQFAVDWFENGAAPAAHLKNSQTTLSPGQAGEIRAQFETQVRNGGTFVSGKDWSYNPIAAKASEAAFIEQQEQSDVALCRYLGVPADMLDVATGATGSLTYANISQRNLQLLVMNLGGAVKRREEAFARLAPAGYFVKLNRSAVLAMDDKTRAEVVKLRIDSRTLTPDEARDLEDQAPLSEDQYQQFDRLWPARTNQPTTQGGGQ
ncbi:phage portal protein [Cellulomonas oligotrophica]|uniref:HK97 family phage portal protein n=1 Tax=Cellulomonas oligotrophica TaxID=931536 RepID=A0A7Y9JYF7_9CELL|nr:phage portal protein [Cellulomonas oligotrophica]NYD87783.1 HK97 family phage portal protein [Cellulomonas oligotrophica]GIG33013.1 hypothetical protein Col01nite_21720 [Cellulomonas oligotrophica]